MPHYFLPPGNIDGDRFVINGDDAHHLVRVLRVKPGERLQLFDGTGKVYTGQVQSVSPDGITGTITGRGETPLPRTAITLFQSVPKGDRFDWLVEKAVELGVAAVIPLITGRSAVREIPEAKVERWKRLVRAAGEQSSRPDLMRIGRPVGFSELLDAAARPPLSIIPWEGESLAGLRETVGTPPPAGIGIVIGPEGGFTPDEIRKARAAGIVPVTLGRRILRVETAGLLAAVLALDHAGEYTIPVVGT